MRDGSNRAEWGSIYCKRILCTMHQERVVDGIIAISSYNEKFCRSKFKNNISQIEHLIDDAVTSITNLLRIEMASLYLRHRYIQNTQIECLQMLNKIINSKSYTYKKCCTCDLTKDDINNMDESKRIQYLNKYLYQFKRNYNKTQQGYFKYDNNIDIDTLAAIEYKYRKLNK